MTPISLITSEEIDGVVILNASWGSLDSVARLDLLQDWIAVLRQLYQLAHHDAYGKGFDWQGNLVDAIGGWEHHGKKPDDYTPSVIKLARPSEEEQA